MTLDILKDPDVLLIACVLAGVLFGARLFGR